MDKKEAALEAMRISCAAAEGQLREAEALRAAEARARRAAERKVVACFNLPLADVPHAKRPQFRRSRAMAPQPHRSSDRLHP